VCHQTVGLVARHLESHGIPTVVMGSAMDIVEHCGVARYLHSDFPLGNPCGKPYDKEMQCNIVNQALALLERAKESGTIKRTPYSWTNDNDWREAYARVDDSNRDHLRSLGDKRRQQQAKLKGSGASRAPMISQR
jgi:D-proline reductase (dithiol) PrdB